MTIRLDQFSDDKKPIIKMVTKYSEVTNEDIVLAHSDALKFLKSVPDDSATLVVTSPPYNIGKVYERRKLVKDYFSWQEQVIKECIRILKTDGSICWQVGNYVEDGEVFPLDVNFYKIFKEKYGLKMRNRIIWKFGHGLHAKKRFSGRYETILWFTKSEKYIFNLDEVRIPSKYWGKRSYKGNNKGKFSCNPKGKNPSDTWEPIFEEMKGEVWDIPNVKSQHPEKTVHPCQFPIELIERLVLALTNEKDLVVDPFCGVGSSLIAAMIYNRKAIGIDKEMKYLKIAFENLQKETRGELKRRSLGTPIYTPKPTDKLVQYPDEWRNGK